MKVKPFKDWKPWQRYTTLSVAGLLLAYGIFLAVVLPSNGHHVKVWLDVGTNADGSMFIRCDLTASTEGACDPLGTDGNPDQARILVAKRDRVKFTVHSLDGGGRAHDFKMEGWQYLLPPARLEMELHHATQSKSLTTYATGTFHIKCELSGHEGKGMFATLVVQ